jgi:hypothetical protein
VKSVAQPCSRSEANNFHILNIFKQEGTGTTGPFCVPPLHISCDATSVIGLIAGLDSSFQLEKCDEF